MIDQARIHRDTLRAQTEGTVAQVLAIECPVTHRFRYKVLGRDPLSGRTAPLALNTSAQRSTRSAACMLDVRLADCERSSSTEASIRSLSSSDTPPLRSAAFSRSASQRACSSLAPFSEST